MTRKADSKPPTWGTRALRWRRNNRRRLNQLMARLVGTRHARRARLAPNTRRILVVRLNHRLGNILFLTPLLRSLAATLPEARIDLVIQKNRALVPLLQSLPSVGHVWIMDNRPLAILRLLRRIRRQHYDLAIDPTGNSASNRIGMALFGARQRMGFAQKDQWLPLTHAARRPRSRHQALQAVELLADSVASPEIARFDTLAVFPDAADRAAAERRWQQTVGDVAGPVVLFFSHATGDKTLAPAWWQAWIRAMQQTAPETQLVEILPTAESTPVDATLPHLAIGSLTELAAFIARGDQFIAADSGPMHLAAASGIPVLGLFQATSPTDYAPLGRACITLEGEQLTPENSARVLISRLTQANEARAEIY